MKSSILAILLFFLSFNSAITLAQTADTYPGGSVAITRQVQFESDNIFTVTLDIKVRNPEMKAFGIVETIPAGWVVNSANQQGHILPGRIEWLYSKYGPLFAQEVFVSYQVQRTNGSGTVAGSWKSVSPQVSGTIGGDVL